MKNNTTNTNSKAIKTKVFTTRSALRVVSSSNPTEEFSKHYKLGSVLGKGSFATVFQATHLETGDQVAVKAIGFGYNSSNHQQDSNNNNNNNKKNNTPTPEQQQKIVMEQVEREINFFSNVPPHPNIIRAREVFTTSSLLQASLSPDALLPQDAAALDAAVAAATPALTSPATPTPTSTPTTTNNSNNNAQYFSTTQQHQQTFIVLEMATGGDLFDVIVKKQGLPEEESRCIFRQLTSAVHHMHSYGFAHSDLKPENILLMAEDEVNNSADECGCKCVNPDGTPIAKPHVTIKVEDFGFTRNKSDYYVASNDEATAAAAVATHQNSSQDNHHNDDSNNNNNTSNHNSAPIPPLLLTRQECQGSFAFVSPEKISVARGKLYAFDAFAADVWSTGVILFMTLSACDPFTNSNPAAHGGRTTFDNIVCGGFKRSAKVWACRGALDLITQMFTVDTAKRALTAEQVADHEWMQGSDGWKLEDFVINDTPAPTPDTTASASVQQAIAHATSAASPASTGNGLFGPSVVVPLVTSLSPATQLMMEMVTEQLQNNEITISIDNSNGVVHVGNSNNGESQQTEASSTANNNNNNADNNNNETNNSNNTAPTTTIVQVPLVAVANMIIQQQQHKSSSVSNHNFVTAVVAADAVNSHSTLNIATHVVHHPSGGGTTTSAAAAAANATLAAVTAIVG